MKDNSKISLQLITDSYEKYHHRVFLYIYHKINNKEEAEDLSQDVFLRLIEYKQMLRPDTAEHFIYTIARNLVMDYLRRYYRHQEVTTYLYDCVPAVTDDVESRINADELLKLEKSKLRLLPPQRKKIYFMSRFEEKSILEISTELSLSFRTVENHLFMGRKDIREYIRSCI